MAQISNLNNFNATTTATRNRSILFDNDAIINFVGVITYGNEIYFVTDTDNYISLSALLSNDGTFNDFVRNIAEQNITTIALCNKILSKGQNLKVKITNKIICLNNGKFNSKVINLNF